MINLLNFVKNHFDTNRISEERFKKFVQDHIGRLNANNQNGQYNVLIQDTTHLYNEYIQSLQNEASGMALQQSRTKSVDNIIEDFKKAIRQKEGLIRAYYDTDTPEYQEFFPRGITEYTEASKANIEIVMQQLTDALANHQNTLGTAVLTQFETLKNDYITNRQIQIQQMSLVDNFNSKITDSRNQLEVQLMKNILDIAKEFIGNSERFGDFFDQSLLELQTSQGDDVIQGTILANATQNIESQGILPTTKIKMKNTGTVTLYFEIMPAANDAATGYVSVLPNKSLTLDAIDMGGINNTFLNVTNPNTSVSGKYEVTLF